MARPLVFSFVSEQRRFLFLLVAFLAFLATVSGGLVLSISTALGRFRSNLDRTGIIQVVRGSKIDTAKKIIKDNQAFFARAKEIDKVASAKLLANWLKSADVLAGYVPDMIEVETKTAAQLDIIAKKAEQEKLRFVYSRNAGPERSAGLRIMGIAGFIFLAVLGALVLSIIHSVRNIITIHRREIEILNQIGATRAYIAWQIQKAMMAIGAKACMAGLGAGWLMLAMINGLAGMAHVGLMANMGMDPADWVITAAVAVLLVISIAFMTSRATLKILAK